MAETIKNSIMKHEKLIREFVAYIFVGGAAFLVDTGTLMLVARLLDNAGCQGYVSDIIGGTAGFCIGLLVNYFLSLIFVFKAKSSLMDFTVIVVIGIFGLIITDGGLVVLHDYLHVWRIAAKIILTAIVFLWNFAARKMLVYKDN